MSFRMPDLIIESVLREGFAIVRRFPHLISDVFGDLDLIFAEKKYGQKEINRIKKFVTEKEVHIIQSFNQVPTNLPCISIQLMSSSEAKNYTSLDDYLKIETFPLDPYEQRDRTILSNVIIHDYNSLTGVVTVDDAVDLTPVIIKNIFVDSLGNEFSIIGGIDNTVGKKKFSIAIGEDVETGNPGAIKSSINFREYEERATIDQEKILLGIHTEERLLTVYLYVLVKYFILSRKADLIKRGFQIASYDASDFTRNQDYNEPVFTRFLTVSGITQHEWISDRIPAIESIDITTVVAKDVATNEELYKEDQTVQVDDDQSQDDE